MAQIDSNQGVFSFHDQRGDGNYIVMLKFNMNAGAFVEDYSVKLDYYPASSEISSGTDLNIFGYNPAQNEMAFIRVSLSHLYFTID